MAEEVTMTPVDAAEPPKSNPLAKPPAVPPVAKPAVGGATASGLRPLKTQGLEERYGRRS